MVQLFNKTGISAEAAEKMVVAAVREAEAIGVPMSIAVVDESGILKAFRRMDGASLLSVEIAQNKAWTAAASRRGTDELFEFIKSDPPLLAGIVHTPRLVVFGGGLPIRIGETVVGGIGLSGGHYSQDAACAKAGLRALD